MQSLSNPFIPCRYFDQSSQQRPKVHTAAPDDNRYRATLRNFSDDSISFPHIVCDGKMNFRIDTIDQMMGCLQPFPRTRFGSTDIESTVYLQ